MKRTVMAIGLCAALAGCSGTRTNTTDNLRTGERDGAADAAARDDAEEVAEDDAPDEGAIEADGASNGSPGQGEQDGGAAADAESGASDAGADGQIDAQADAASWPEGWGPDGPPPDASTDAGSDAGPDAEALPAETYAFAADITGGELAQAIASAAAVAVSDDELTQTSARAFELVTAGSVGPEDALSANDDAGSGLVANLLIEWGYLEGTAAPTSLAWRDLSGYVAVGDGGSIELVRAVRVNGASEPSAPRPSSDGVAPQSDGHLVRFRSFIGAGRDGLLLRLRRSAIKPVVVAISVAGVVHYHTFEDFLAVRGESGGWAIPYGQVGTSCAQSPSRRCYVKTGTLTGTFALRSSPNTALASFSGEIARTDGSHTPLVLQAGSELRGPYGTLAGTLGSAPAGGYFGRDWLFSNYTDEGIVVGKLGEAAGSAQEMFVALYDRTALKGATVFRSAACDEPGAERGSPYRF